MGTTFSDLGLAASASQPKIDWDLIWTLPGGSQFTDKHSVGITKGYQYTAQIRVACNTFNATVEGKYKFECSKSDSTAIEINVPGDSDEQFTIEQAVATGTITLCGKHGQIQATKPYEIRLQLIRMQRLNHENNVGKAEQVLIEEVIKSVELDQDETSIVSDQDDYKKNEMEVLDIDRQKSQREGGSTRGQTPGLDDELQKLHDLRQQLEKLADIEKQRQRILYETKETEVKIDHHSTQFTLVHTHSDSKQPLLELGVVYAIKSVSSERYLDGRNTQKEARLTDRDPKEDQFLLWTLIKTNNGYAIKSCSSNKYLNGRNEQKLPLMTYRDPANDPFLQWTFEQCNLGIAIKSASSLKYLDGRGPSRNKPCMTGRNPMYDKYLQWHFIRYY